MFCGNPCRMGYYFICIITVWMQHNVYVEHRLKRMGWNVKGLLVVVVNWLSIQIRIQDIRTS